MLTNLSRELRRKKITHGTVAKRIGVSERTLANKLSGRTEFTVREALVIHRSYFPELPPDYLFAEDDRPE